jgi:hypothetical protein
VVELAFKVIKVLKELLALKVFKDHRVELDRVGLLLVELVFKDILADKERRVCADHRVQEDRKDRRVQLA